VGAGLVAGSYALALQEVNFYYVALASSGVLLLYHLDRAFNRSPEDRINQPERSFWFESHRSYVWSSTLVALSVAGFSLWHLGLRFLLPTALLAIVGSAYGLSFLPQGRRPKAVPHLKMGLIAGAWAYGGVVLPVVSSSDGLLTIAAILALYRLPLLLANLLVTDAVDREGDREAGIRSAFMNRGKPFVRRAAFVLTLLHVVAAAVLGTLLHSYLLFSVDGVGGVLAAAVLWRMRELDNRVVFYLDLSVGWPLITFLTTLIW
jgi:4-hydroxybenzoate polyprenyltransferase